MFVGTWNVGGKSPHEGFNIRDWLMNPSLADIYVLGCVVDLLDAWYCSDKNKSTTLDWSKRFKIIVGVARGLLYLHEDSPERIIHRDIKAGNILLDGMMNPKISDFGLARLFPGTYTHLSTFNISGTYGYMAPEYALRGYLTVRTDVFSYGILVLEIVSGRHNYDQLLNIERADLLTHAWRLWEEGKAIKLIDPTLAKFNSDEVAMCIHLGLLCCQASVAERPDMNSVNLMLMSDSFNLPRHENQEFKDELDIGVRYRCV